MIQRKRQGLVLPLVLILAVVFAMLVFGMHSMQQNEMGQVAKTLNQQRALTLAEAGLNRAMARIVSRHWTKRWYNDEAPDSSDTDGLNFSGTFDSTLADQNEDDDVTTPLDPDGTYEVFVQDMENPDTAQMTDYSEHATRLAQATVDHTEIFSVGTFSGRGEETRVIIYGRVAIVPEPLMYSENPSAEEVFKKVFTYREFYDRNLVSGDVIHDDAARQVFRSIAEVELAAYAHHFQQNLETVKAIRNSPLNIPDQKTFTSEEINGLFGSYPPIDTTDFDETNIVYKNKFADEMVRNYRISDCLSPDDGIRYELDQSVKDRAQDGTASAPVQNIRDVFFPDEPLYAIDDDFLQTPSLVDTGAELIDKQANNNTDSPNYQTDIANCLEFYFSAAIPTGLTSTTSQGVVYYLDNRHEAAFMTEGRNMADYPAAMDSDAIALGETPPDCYTPSISTGTLPISMVITDSEGNEISLPVKEFLNFYLKYMNSRAEVSEWDLEIPTIIPPEPWEPPPATEPPTPPPPPPSGNNDGSSSSGGSTPFVPSGPPPASMGGIGGGGVGG